MLTILTKGEQEGEDYFFKKGGGASKINSIPNVLAVMANSMETNSKAFGMN